MTDTECKPVDDVMKYHLGTWLVFVGTIAMTSALFLQRIR